MPKVTTKPVKAVTSDQVVREIFKALFGPVYAVMAGAPEFHQLMDGIHEMARNTEGGYETIRRRVLAAVQDPE
jgi:hypothetical protein